MPRTLSPSGECSRYSAATALAEKGPWELCGAHSIPCVIIAVSRADFSLRKDPNARPTYAELLQHPWLLADKDADVDMPAWVAQQMELQAQRTVVPLAEVEA